jgi:hypothetical protein
MQTQKQDKTTKERTTSLVNDIFSAAHQHAITKVPFAIARCDGVLHG